MDDGVIGPHPPDSPGFGSARRSTDSHHSGEATRFATWLRAAMGRQGLTVSELARTIGVSRVTVSTWLGARSRPSPASLASLADALCLPTEMVFAAAGIQVVDDGQLARVADLLGKVDRVRLTPDRISGLSGLLDAWLAVDGQGSAHPGRPARPANGDFVVRFVPIDDRAAGDLGRAGSPGGGNARSVAAIAVLRPRGETGEVRLAAVRDARSLAERIATGEPVSPWERTSPPPGIGPPTRPERFADPAARSDIQRPAMEQVVPVPLRTEKENPVTVTQAHLAATNDEQVYTLAEAARLKGVSYHTVSRAVRQGKLPHHRLGRMAFITAANLAAWRPMVERAPKKYARRVPDPAAAPAMLDLASGDRVLLAQRFSILSEGLHAAAADKPIGDVLDLLARRFAESLDLNRVSIWELDEATGAVRRLAAYGRAMSASPDDAPDVAGAIWELAAVESASVRDASNLAQPNGPLAGTMSLFVAPLRMGRRSLGLVLGDCSGAPFALDSDQLAFAQALGNQAALVLEVAGSHERLVAARRAQADASAMPQTGVA